MAALLYPMRRASFFKMSSVFGATNVVICYFTQCNFAKRKIYFVSYRWRFLCITSVTCFANYLSSIEPWDGPLRSFRWLLTSSFYIQRSVKNANIGQHFERSCYNCLWRMYHHVTYCAKLLEAIVQLLSTFRRHLEQPLHWLHVRIREHIT